MDPRSVVDVGHGGDADHFKLQLFLLYNIMNDNYFMDGKRHLYRKRTHNYKRGEEEQERSPLALALALALVNWVFVGYKAKRIYCPSAV